MSEPAALDLAAIQAQLEYGTVFATERARQLIDRLVDELERCRAERDALCVALERIRDYSYLAGEGLPRAIALEALGEVTQ